MKIFVVLLSLIATSVVKSEDKAQFAKCARNKDRIEFESYLITKDHRDMDAFPIQEIKYCEIKGTFVFYSEEGYEVSMIHDNPSSYSF